MKFLIMILMLVSSQAFAVCTMTFAETNRCENAGYEHTRLMRKLVSDLGSVYGYKLIPGSAGKGQFHFYIETTATGQKNDYSSGVTYNLRALVTLFQIDPSVPGLQQIYKNGSSVAYGTSFTSNPKVYDEMSELVKKSLATFPHCQN